MKALLLVALCATGSWSIEEMIIGPGGLPWTAVIEESTKMGVDRDSIWTWNVQAGVNLAPGALVRGGRVFSTIEGIKFLCSSLHMQGSAPWCFFFLS